MTYYQVSVYTGTKDGAGTDAKIYISLYGTNGRLENKLLKDYSDKDDFESGDVNIIILSSSIDLGNINSIKIWHDNSGKRPGWFLDKVSIKNTSTNQVWTFDANRWLAKDEADGKTEVTLYLFAYDITVYTGDVEDAGTDANVSIILHGTKGNSKQTRLSNSAKDTFERGRYDVFQMTSNDIGDIKMITIQHDNSGKKAGWFLDGVKVRCFNNNKTWHFPAYRWLAKDEGDLKTYVTLSPGKEMVHYSFINNYPKNRENGFSHEINGVCHDDRHWFFAQNESKDGKTGGTLWKIPASMNLNGTFNGKETGVQKNKDGGHMGDIDFYKDYVFVPVKTTSGENKICVYHKDDISKEVVHQEMVAKIYNGKKEVVKSFHFKDIGWLAINSKGYLFTSDGGINSENPIIVYRIDISAIQKRNFSDFLIPYANLYLVDELNENLDRAWMQGGCFDNSDQLYLTNGKYTGYANGNGGITVYDVPELSQNFMGKAKLLTKSNQTHDFQFDFGDFYHEPEGITYWDLDAIGAPVVPYITGQLHAIVMDGSVNGHEDLYFKHFKKV